MDTSFVGFQPISHKIRTVVNNHVPSGGLWSMTAFLLKDCGRWRRSLDHPILQKNASSRLCSSKRNAVIDHSPSKGTPSSTTVLQKERGYWPQSLSYHWKIPIVLSLSLLSLAWFWSNYWVFFWKNSGGSFTEYPLGTLWTLHQHFECVCSVPRLAQKYTRLGSLWSE